jgi:hypothetical protein
MSTPTALISSPLLEERVDVDADRADFLSEHYSGMKTPPAGAQRAREVAKNVEEETDRDSEAPKHNC